MQQRNDIPLRATGRWREILPRLGIETTYLQKKQGPCPVCRAGKDRFRFDDKNGRGTWYCNQCGAGDGFRLLEKVKGWDFKRAVDEVGKIVGDAKPIRVNAPPEQTPEEVAEGLARQWVAARALTQGDPVLAYLAGRNIKPRIWRDLRYATDGNDMLAMFRAPDGKPCTLHRTPLRGGKKLLAAGAKVIAGGAVRLMGHKEVLGVGEGIETCLSAFQLTGVPCWACLTADLLAKWEPPEGVKKVVIFGDNDRHYVGQTSAYNLARRLAGRHLDGKRVYDIEVRIPDKRKDWNDVLCQN